MQLSCHLWILLPETAYHPQSYFRSTKPHPTPGPHPCHLFLVSKWPPNTTASHGDNSVQPESSSCWPLQYCLEMQRRKNYSMDQIKVILKAAKLTHLQELATSARCSDQQGDLKNWSWSYMTGNASQKYDKWTAVEKVKTEQRRAIKPSYVPKPEMRSNLRH